VLGRQVREKKRRDDAAAMTEGIGDTAGRPPTGTVEIVLAVVLAMSGLLTSWSSYQATLWSGEQDVAYNRANTLRIEAARAGARADLLRAVDLAVFSSWLGALAAGEERLQQFYRARFRPEFAVALDQWAALDPENNPDAPPTPFAMAEYRSRERDEAQALEAQADAAFEEARRYDNTADAYVQSTVILASAMFLAGVCQVFRSAQVKIGLAALAGATCALGVVHLVRLPALAL
jgi:hypothetical protein